MRKDPILFMIIGLLIGYGLANYLIVGTTWYSDTHPFVRLSYTPDIDQKLGFACEYWSDEENGKGFHLPLEKATQRQLNTKIKWLLSGEGLPNLTP